jgi:hypothetical protein
MNILSCIGGEDYLFLQIMVETNEKQVAKKRTFPPSQITNFFGSQKYNSQSNQTQQDFLEDLMLYNAKGYYPLSFIENLWLRCLILHQCECT